MAIDTLKVARRLREAGFNEAQADALVAAELKAEIGSVKNSIEAAKIEILGRMLQMILSAVLINIVAMAGLMFAFAKLLGH